MSRPPDRLLKVLLHWTALTTLVFWLGLVRSVFDGTSYRWGLFGLAGRGVGGDFWFLPLAAGFALLLLWLGWRSAPRPWFHALLLAWHGFLAVGAVALALTSPESLLFEGDTLGIRFSLAWAAAPLFGGFAVAAVVWIWRDLRFGRPREASAWSRRNRLLLGALAALLPVQFALLRFGEPHGASDAAGVLLTIAQWLLLGKALEPPRAEP